MPPVLSILMIAPEVSPFSGSGGVAEAAGALPRALARLGHRVTVVVPRHGGTYLAGGDAVTVGLWFGHRLQDVTLRTLPAQDGVTLVFVEVPELFDRAEPYGEDGQDYADNAWRFGVFARAALECARVRGERPSVIHAHDWQSGLVPVFQKMQLASDPVVGGVPVVFTIHHLDRQGVFPSAALPALGLGWEVFDVQAMEYWGQISYLKAGINFSECLTAVGDIRRMQTAEAGLGFDGVLRRRSDDLFGVAQAGHGTKPASDAAWDASAREYVKVYEAAGATAPVAEPARA